MIKPSLSQLYQSLTSEQTLSARALIDADTALRAARGRVVPHEREEVATALAGSAAHADLVQFLHALEPASAELARDLAHSGAAHERRERGHRAAQGARPRRWQFGAVAAGIVAAVALFVARTGQTPLQPYQAPVAAADRGDEIFSGSLDRSVAQRSTGDQIFRANTDGGTGGDGLYAPRGG
ncbi:hypothetical protein [Tahibacter caeni]|uniref:hypothetical protein n=1 Tax=Tahibacter caeni TaxID=1453545 RepID=UPI00214985CC|nr:hypothetical protein [Tahibacter caeni]